MKKRKSHNREVLRSAWEATLEALASAEAEVQHQVKVLLKKNRLGSKDAQALLRNLGSRLQNQRKRTLKDLEARAKSLQTRLQKERKALAQIVRDNVERALAGLNIPSRAEVKVLTRRVEELSRKVSRRKR